MPESNEAHFLLSVGPVTVRCPAYCDCELPNHIDDKKNIVEQIKCRCGETDLPETSEKAWTWQSGDTEDTRIDGADITFHPVYSQGTAIVRGDQDLKVGMVHFWEMRVITPLAGTDVMFGIGTDKLDLRQFQFHFVSALGTNGQSWGFSYSGKVHHNGEQQSYGQKFSQGCLVGVQLDRVRGHLEYFLNRRSLGVAYTNVPLDPSVKLYPMVCSTAARSVVRLVNSSAQPDCLQLRAFQALAKQPAALAELRQLPGLRPILRAYWFMAPPVRYSRRSADTEYDIADEAVLSRTARSRRKHKFKDDDADIIDLYANAHKIISTQHRSNDSDDDLATPGECFDEHFHYLF